MSDDKTRARIKKYLSNTVDSIMVRVPKGQKEKIQDAAARRGQSVNKYCADAINEKLERDNQGPDPE